MTTKQEQTWTLSALRTLAIEAGVEFGPMADKSPVFLRWVRDTYPDALPMLRARWPRLSEMFADK